MIILVLASVMLLLIGIIGMLGEDASYTNESWNNQLEEDYNEKKWVDYYNKYENKKPNINDNFKT